MNKKSKPRQYANRRKRTLKRIEVLKTLHTAEAELQIKRLKVRLLELEKQEAV